MIARRQIPTAVCLLILATAGIIYTADAKYLFSFTIDDTFIFLRYADNWALGHGIVYNLGERVQGYTSFLWLAYLAGLRSLNMPLLETAKLTGLLLGLGTVLVSYLLGRAAQGGHDKVIFTPLLLVSFLSLPHWAVSGMETPFFTLLVTVATWLYLRSWGAPKLFLPAAIFYALATLTRPEGLLFFAVTVTFEMFRVRFRPSASHLMGIGFVGTVVLAYCGWSHWYYGELLPNTFYAKRLLILHSLASGLHDIRFWLKDSGGAILVLLSAASLLAPEQRRAMGYLLLCVSTLLLYYIWIGGDVLNVVGTYRFTVAILPMLAVMMEVGIKGLCKLVILHLDCHHHIFVRAAATAVVIVMLLPTGINQLPAGRYAGNQEMAQFLKAAGREGDALAVNDIGQFGYYSHLRIVDLFGLVDSWIAHNLRKQTWGSYRSGDTRKLVEYVFSRQPRFVILKGTGIPPDMEIADEYGGPDLYRDPRFKARYVFVRTAAPYLLFVSRNAPVAN